MKVAVVGLWHLGTVIAACLGKAGHEVVGIDEDRTVIAGFVLGKPPIFEPGLEETCKAAVQAGGLRFSSDLASTSDADLVWIAYDTPVDEQDVADVEFVKQKVQTILQHLRPETLVLISSQVPVGFTKSLMEYAQKVCPEKELLFGYSPENLRLGKAIQIFMEPDRVVVGISHEKARLKVLDLLKSFTDNIVWMSIESAEMTKHALNAFLALSITYINEVAAICEQVGADAKEVELGLKTEARIGSAAYLGPGAGFAGGTLARDIEFLSQLSSNNGLKSPILSAVRLSNDEHKNWPARRLQQKLLNLDGKVIAVLGLTYKPGTDTLRRSSAVELCEWLLQQGSTVQAHDPVITALPQKKHSAIKLKNSIREAVNGANAVVVATEWPEFNEITAEQLTDLMQQPLVLDANAFLKKNLASDRKIDYLTVGKA
ncbi:MAG: UDP-glucose/GDP-mannose dehydrogenase family protein [Cyanobacteria bacterium SZAS-4]|nr:UDP-glucose/GDP-mannose dehydrogenase family protein [Cyanobacteria bacterium SZAS-4]